MGSQEFGERTQAVEAFTKKLSDLRDSVGNPSFRDMAGRSGVISHTTLHEAAAGNRLPSWHTTVEFVKACGADPEGYRSWWEQAERVTRRKQDRAKGAVGLPQGLPDESGVDLVKKQDKRAGRYVGGSIGVVSTVVLVFWAWGSWASQDVVEDTQPSASVPVECPVQQSDPPPAEPLHQGDAAAFLADITLPDCELVSPGQTVIKTWRFENAGSVAWKGYTLHRLDAQSSGECQTFPEVPVPNTDPGVVVDISTPVMLPDAQGSCLVRFKMRDSSGQDAFPAGRPVYLHVIVSEEGSGAQ